MSGLDPSDIKRGDVLRYHPVIGLPEYIRVRVMHEPWELGSGDWICKAQGINDGKIYRPSVDALAREP